MKYQFKSIFFASLLMACLSSCSNGEGTTPNGVKPKRRLLITKADSLQAKRDGLPALEVDANDDN